MSVNLANSCKFAPAMGYQAAGTNDTLAGTTIDTLGYDGVVFVGKFGTITATAVTTFKAQHDDAYGMGTVADVTGATISVAADDDNQVAVVDVYRPRRYVRIAIVRATANAVVDGVVAILYKGRKSPVTQDSTLVATGVVATAVGIPA